MAAALLSPNARLDLIGVADYTTEQWGAAQAARYINQLESCLDRLGGHPLLGRRCDEIRPGLRRYEEGKHVIFYRRYMDDIGIVRILHASMLPVLHISAEDEQFK